MRNWFFLRTKTRFDLWICVVLTVVVAKSESLLTALYISLPAIAVAALIATVLDVEE